MKTLTSLQHPIVKYFLKLRNNRNFRYSEGFVLVEGPKMIREICRSVPAEVILTTNPSLCPQEAKNKEQILVTDAIIKKVCGTQNPEGIVAKISMPKQTSLKALNRVIALDGVNDPGNMGTLLRTALAFGWKGAFILNGSCDPFNDKALRAAKGATFHLPLRFGSWNELKQLSVENQWTPYLADMEGEPIEKLPINTASLLVLGNEAKGASLEAEQFCHKITIPMTEKMESLNVSVAGGIIMYIISSKSVK